MKVTAKGFLKNQPTAKVGTMLGSIILFFKKEKYHAKVQDSLTNFDGIRLNAIFAGSKTRGKIFEISPFDNIIALENVSGLALQHLPKLVIAKCASYYAVICRH